MKCIFDRNRLAALAAAGLGLILANSTDAAVLNANWQQEYDGTNPHTIALYHFNEDNTQKNSAPDYSTYAAGDFNINSFANNAETESGGKFGWGLNFDQRYTNASAAVTAGSVSKRHIFPQGENPSLTVEMWVKLNDITTSGQQYLIDKMYTHHSGYQMKYWKDNGLYFYVGDGTEILSVSVASPNLQADTWYHLAGVYDSDTQQLKLYINDTQVASTQADSSFIIKDQDGTDNPLKLYIGNRAASSYGSFNGVIDEVRISDVAYNFVPEPASGLAVGLLAAGWMLRRRRPRDLA